MKPEWVRREPPLAPAAVAACGEVADTLVAAVRGALAEGRGARLRAVRDAEWVVVLAGEAGGTDLPWVDGAIWLGEDSGVFVPTHLAVRPGAALVAGAARRYVPDGHGLIVMLAEPGLLLSSPVPVRPVTEAELS
ncbi:bpX5 domain-containing protein [Streptomyces sp. NBC_01465]|uniref:bpX5 domain-containing protein n=1 Tax=Streptomyces sp. NBC_01465 TaxID=2903878 RepID=UPI002E34BE6D|nr:hypothetical protein [Streptomyces sp. NBC_01465]